MDSVARVKRRRCESFSSDKCIICQTAGKEATRKATPQGMNTVRDAISKRIQYNCDKYLDAIDLLQSGKVALDASESSKIIWHKNCFSSFTSSSHLDRLKRRFESSLAKSDATARPIGSSTQASVSTSEPQKTASRSSIPAVQWDKCIYCQSVTKGNTHQVMTLETSDKILNGTKHDCILRCRLAGISDLVAAEAKYHLKCHSSFMQKLNINPPTDTENLSDHSHICFTNVVKELEKGLDEGNIYTVKSVWDRYCELATCETNISVYKDSNKLRAFRKKLVSYLGNKIELVSNTNKNESLLIVPTVTKDKIFQTLKANAVDQGAREAEGSLQRFSMIGESDDILKSIYHVSSKVKMDIKNCKGHTTYTGIDKDHAEDIVPQSLFLLLSLILGDNDESHNYGKILSIAQDIIYVQSKGRKYTPKHIGLGVTLHHMTRSKQIVQLIHEAGHCISYEAVQRVDTSIAKNELSHYRENNNKIMPSNLVDDRFVQFGADNIDIIEDVLDGKGTFHATQCAAFQYGKCSRDITSDSSKVIGKERSLGSLLPADFHQVLDSGYCGRQRPLPVFDVEIQQKWFRAETSSLNQAKAKDLSWLLCRMEEPEQQHIPAWTGFHHVVSPYESEVTSVGYMPILPVPADEMDTVYTVIRRCKHIAESLNLSHTVITFDQALYCRAKEVVWLRQTELKNVIIRLGSFHTAMNFIKVIGQHMDGSGLKDVWVESRVFGETTTSGMFTGKSYNKAVRGHKLTLEALWRILWPKLIKWVGQVPEVERVQMAAKELVEKLKTHDLNTDREYEQLVCLLSEMLSVIDQFDESQRNKKTYMLWRQYMDMVSTLLAFIRADREGNWSLHLESFTKMLPMFHRYDHTNYARWGIVYLADMRSLPETAPNIHREFQKGKFSIKHSNSRFSQIGPDQALEHINRVAKVCGGLVGITRNQSARDKWCLTLNEKSALSDVTLKMFGMDLQDVNDDWAHQESGPARLERDESDIKKLIHELERFQVFNRPTGDLVVISTSDVAPDEIASCLISAEDLGEKMVDEFVKERLQEKNKDFYSKLTRQKPHTLENMYQVKVRSTKGNVKTVKADRDLLRRLLVAAQGGRDIDMKSILEHELSPVPTSLASMDSRLNKTNKADLADVLTEELDVTGEIPKSRKRSCVLIDGPALIQSIGKPDSAQTFGDLADTFTTKVISNFGATCTRVDVLFDRYKELSIKTGTREQRTGSIRPIRRVIDSRDVKLPQSWKQFISLPANKENLASFLSQELSTCSDKLPPNSELVIAGGFANIMETRTTSERDVTHLMADHEEADTRVVLHASDALKEGFERIIINCRDTDVLVMMVSICSDSSSEIWFRAGTAKKVRNIPVHKISNIPQVVRQNLCSFHALTGCDSTSQFTGKSKKSAWKVFLKHPQLLDGMGKKELSEKAFKDAERFVCILYTGDDKAEHITNVRYNLFVKGKPLVSLPPTRDALKQHVERANYQSYVWNRATSPLQDLPDPTTKCWSKEGNTLKPVLMTLDSVPEKCHQLVTCQCRCGCTFRCGCATHNMPCIPSCRCGGVCHNLANNFNEEND